MAKYEPKRPIIGMVTHTFVRNYLGPSQMNINTINGVNISAHASRLIQRVYRAFEEAEEENDDKDLSISQY